MSANELLEIVFSFDTTGSMRTILAQVRREVENVVTRLFNDLPNCRIGIVTHGCYRDGEPKFHDLSTNLQALCRFIREVPDTSGGGNHACYEVVMKKVQSFGWSTSAKARALVMIGDEPAHDPRWPQCYGAPAHITDWREELLNLTKAGVQIFGVQALDNSYATQFYKEISEKSGGAHLRMYQFGSITDIMTAIALRSSGDMARLENFENELVQAGRFTREYDNVFSALNTNRQRRFKDTGNGLIPEHPARFQLLKVGPSRIRIDEFVRANIGADQFQPGRGFYEFSQEGYRGKAEEIQPYKEVILQDRITGDFYTGAAARKMIGLSEHKTDKLRPDVLGGQWRAFVQSTSTNRVLKENTFFLYEVQGWKAGAAAPIPTTPLSVAVTTQVAQTQASPAAAAQVAAAQAQAAAAQASAAAAIAASAASQVPQTPLAQAAHAQATVPVTTSITTPASRARSRRKNGTSSTVTAVATRSQKCSKCGKPNHNARTCGRVSSYRP